MNAKQARYKTDEVIARNRKNADLTEILEKIGVAIEDEMYHIKLLRMCDDMGKQYVYITDNQIHRLKNDLNYLVEDSCTDEGGGEINHWITIKW